MHRWRFFVYVFPSLFCTFQNFQLEMLGYDISWAAFNIIEVMSSSKFTFKRIGYLAASQSFHEGTDVLMLTTNMIRKVSGTDLEMGKEYI